MFNLERANQFFMLIMNQPGGPAALLTELEEQVHGLAWASVVMCAGEAQLQGEPLLGALYLLGRECVHAVYVNACTCIYIHTCVYIYRHVFVHVYLHAYLNVGTMCIGVLSVSMSKCLCAHICMHIYYICRMGLNVCIGVYTCLCTYM